MSDGAAVVLGDKNVAPAVTTLPLAAIVRSQKDKNRFAVFVLDSGATPPVVHQKEVELGNFLGNNIPVMHGLAPDAQVVVQGASMLSEGEPVRVIP